MTHEMSSSSACLPPPPPLPLEPLGYGNRVHVIDSVTELTIALCVTDSSILTGTELDRSETTRQSTRTRIPSTRACMCDQTDELAKLVNY